MTQYAKGPTRWHAVEWRTEYSPHRVCDWRPLPLTTAMVDDPRRLDGPLCRNCERARVRASKKETTR